jgi:hypothetical protein
VQGLWFPQVHTKTNFHPHFFLAILVTLKWYPISLRTDGIQHDFCVFIDHSYMLLRKHPFRFFAYFFFNWVTNLSLLEFFVAKICRNLSVLLLICILYAKTMQTYCFKWEGYQLIESQFMTGHGWKNNFLKLRNFMLTISLRKKFFKSLFQMVKLHSPNEILYTNSYMKKIKPFVLIKWVL